jgi:hypothetical protein
LLLLLLLLLLLVVRKRFSVSCSLQHVYADMHA